MARIKDLAAWREAKMKEEFLTNMAFLRAHDPVAADVLVLTDTVIPIPDLFPF